jgi:LCP family protein required for cell wall assembly
VPTQPNRVATRHNRRHRVRHIFIACISFGMILALTSGVAAIVLYKYYDGKIKRVAVLNTSDTNIRQPDKQLHAANYLVIGSDSRAGTAGQYGDTDGARSDTTMLVHLSPDRSRATVISIPRDAWLSIPACSDGKGGTTAAHVGQFNSAYTEGGAACTINTVQALTGIAITHYVEINFDGFKAIINALGSVTICSPSKVKDTNSGLVLNVGNNVLNGDQALAYVRARESLGDGSDLGRIKRQQRFLGAVLREARGGKLFATPTALTSFLDAATKAITVDTSTSILDMKTLFDALRGLDPSKVTFYTAPIANSAYNPDNPGTPGGRVLLDANAGKVLYDQIINDQTVTVSASSSGATPTPSATPVAATAVTVAPSTISVDVTNGVGTALLATKVQNALTGIGFGEGVLGSGVTGTTTTIIKFAAAQLAAAQTVAAAIPNSTMQEDDSRTGAIEVVVGTSYSGVQAVKVGDPLPSWVNIRVSTPGTSATTGSAATPTGISAADTTCTE